MNPLISIIVPVYNVRKYLKRCVDSILGQTYKEIEVILVDDGSTDGSGDLCDEYASNNKRVKVIHKKNGGLSSARNVGIDKARGEYIAFVDSDDYVADTYVETLFDLILEFDVNMSVIGTIIITVERTINGNKEETKRILLSTVEALKSILVEKNFTVSANGKMYKKSLFKDVRYPEGKLYEDNGCTYKLIMGCDGVAYSDAGLYYYCIRDGSITSKEFSEKKLDYVRLTENACKEIVAKYPELKNQCLYRRAAVRISILRQMLEANLSKKHQQEKRTIEKWLKSNAKQLVFGKGSPKKVRISVMALIASENLLKLIGRLYEKNK